MNYLTVFFNERRIVPARSLRVPLCEINNEARICPLPLIYEGGIYTADKKNGLRARNEQTFEIARTADIEFQRAGIFAAGLTGMCVRSSSGNFHRVTWDTMDSEEICADSPYFWNGHDTFSRAGFSILDSKEGEGLRAPKYITRKELDECASTWEFKPDVPRTGFGASDDFVVVQDVNGKIYVLDITTGEAIWSKSTEALGVLTADEIEMRDKGSARDYPHIIDGIIVVGSHLGYLLGIELETGNLLWKKKINSSASYPCVTEKGELYKLTGEWGQSATMLKLNASSGEIIEEIDLTSDMIELGLTNLLRDQVYGDVTETHFWGTTTHGLLFAVNLSTGKIDWHNIFDERIPFHDHFVICNNRLYMTTMNQLITFEGAGGYIKD